jgi:hypothetical protein
MALHLLFAKNSQKLKKNIFFALGTIVALSWFTAIHPGTKFNLGIFEGRGEAFVDGEGKPRNEIIENLKLRIAESVHIFGLPRHNEFRTEFKEQAGWLEVILLIIFLIPFISKSKLFGELKSNLFLQSIIIVSIVGLAIPLLSTTFVRGHRFYNFYVASTILAFLLLNMFYRNANIRIQNVFKLLAIFISFGFGAIQLKNIHAYSVPHERHANPAGFNQLVEKFNNIDKNSISRPQNPTEAKICDAENMIESNWNVALRIGKVGCHLNIDDTRVICECEPEDSKDFYCIKRSIKSSNTSEVIIDYVHSKKSGRKIDDSTNRVLSFDYSY